MKDQRSNHRNTNDLVYSRANTHSKWFVPKSWVRFFPPSIFSTAFQRLHLAGNFEYEFLSSGVAPLFCESFPTTTVGTVVRPWPEFRVFTKKQDFAKGPKIKDFCQGSKISLQVAGISISRRIRLQANLSALGKSWSIVKSLNPHTPTLYELQYEQPALERSRRKD